MKAKNYNTATKPGISSLATIMRLFSLSALLAVLAGCVETDAIRPAFVMEDAHSSGSLVAVDGQAPLAVSGGLEGTLALWNLEDGRRLAAWKGHQDTVNGLALSSRQGFVLSGSWDATLALWDLRGRLVRRVNAGAPVTAMVADPALSLVWTGHADGSLRRWNRDLELQAERHLPGGRRVTALAMHDDRLAVADDSGRLWLLAPRDEGQPRLLAELPAYLRTLVYRPDTGELFGGTWFSLYRWDRQGRMTRLATPHRGIIKSLAWSPADRELMSISRQTDSAVLALDPDNGELKRNFGSHDLCGASVAVSRDGRYLITTSDDASVRIWHLDEKEGDKQEQ